MEDSRQARMQRSLTFGGALVRIRPCVAGGTNMT